EARTSVDDISPPPAEVIPAHAHILLIDDHSDTLRSLARLLSRRGHTVTIADSCATALAHFANAKFDIVISDLGLPDRSGIELITDIRKTSSIPAIAMSGYGMEADLLRSKEAGFNLHLIKPVELGTLLAAIHRLCAN
ncbi:MAG: domain S-box, partial [Verrucomicrobiaceae bacterium]|nr:domain S-box [Verrucomicrobiaceae bacterium]